MKIQKKIEEVGGIEIKAAFESKKNNNIDVDTYLKLNDLKLPDAYINFSLKYGFGQFNNDIVFKSIDKIPVDYDDGTTPITFIYGWGFGGESLQETRISLADQISSNYFVFAEGNPGDYLLINTVDEKIYYYAHQGAINNSIFLVADSFQQFIESLLINENCNSEDGLEEEWFSDDF
jgi:hypothetical protein